MTRETLFALAFGTEAIALVEVGLKSLRIEFADLELNDESLRSNLDLLEEKQEQDQRGTENYQRKTARYYDRKVRPNSFKLVEIKSKRSGIRF